MTYSIAAADRVTREVGGSGASCLGGQDVYVIYAAVPGRGVVHAQARYNLAGKERAIELLQQGEPPADIIAALTQSSFDANAGLRQYGIVDVDGSSAGFTGAQTMPYSEDRQGSVGEVAYSVQGNILTSAHVLDQAAAAFEGGGCDLAERLMRGLEAGAAGGEGDSRCTPDGIPSDSAYLQVEIPDAAPGEYLSLRVESSGTQDPLPLLREKLDAWRAEHPCPVPVTPSEPVGVTAGAPMTAGASSITPGPAPSEGCGCHLPRTDSVLAGWLLLGGLLVVARRLRAAR